MDFTIFTFSIAIFWVSIFVKVVSLLRKQLLFLKNFSLYPLLMVFLFCIMRLFLSVELPFTRVINSQRILPFIQSFLCTSFLQIGLVKINLVFIISFIWGIVAISIIIKHVRNYCRFRHLMDLLQKTENKHLYDVFSKVNKNGVLSNVKIVVHESIESPAIFGFYKPVILLPNIYFSDDELIGIFIHESTHYKYGHGLIKCITGFICACFWWNPFFRELSSEVAHVLEMHSDKAVCKRINSDQQKIYLESITKVASNINYNRLFSSYTCSLVEEKNNEKLNQRFKMISGGYYSNNKVRDFLMMPVITIIFILSYSVVLQPYSIPDLSTLGAKDEVASDCYLIETENGYNLYDSDNSFIALITYIDESLSGLKIYRNEKERLINENIKDHKKNNY